MTILGAAILVCLAALFIWMLVRRRGSGGVAGLESTTAPGPVQAYLDLRAAALNARPGQVGLDPQQLGDAPYGVLMEMCFGASTATLASFADGSASLYYSTGGGVIGGCAHETVRQAARAFVSASADHLSILTNEGDSPLPRPSHVRFHVLTCSGVLTAEEEERKLVGGRSPLSSFFRAGNEVLTQFRLTIENRTTA